MDDARSNVVKFPFDIKAEASVFARRYGKNAYSDFLLTHRQRPSREQAATIGRLMAIRVRADDGSLQPEPSQRERAAAREAKRSRQAEADYLDQIVRFRCVLTSLAKNQSDPADVISYIDPLFGDESVIREQLAHAVYWINRFAEEWEHEQESRGGPGQV